MSMPLLGMKHPWSQIVESASVHKPARPVHNTSTIPSLKTLCINYIIENQEQFVGHIVPHKPTNTFETQLPQDICDQITATQKLYGELSNYFDREIVIDPKVITSLLVDGAAPDTYTPQCTTALIYATRTGNIELARLLIECGALVNFICRTKSSGRHFYPNPPLNILMMDNPSNIELLKLLLDNDADPNIPDNGGLTPLWRTYKENQPEALLMLLQHKANATMPDPKGNFLLHTACQRGQDSIVKMLLEHGVDPNMQDAHGNRALHVVTSVDSAHMLFEYNADPNTLNLQGQTPLDCIINADRINPDVIRLLLQHDAQTQQTNIESQFYNAYTKGNTPKTAALLQLGINPNLSYDDSGQTALHVACELENIELVHILLEHHANPFVPDHNGKTPFLIARKRQYTRILQHIKDSFAQTKKFHDNLLYGELSKVESEIDPQNIRDAIRDGANQNMQNEQGNTALHYAVSQGNYQLAEFLLQSDASVNIVNLDNKHALNLLCSMLGTLKAKEPTTHQNIIATAKLLLKYGAHHHTQDRSKLKPLNYACMYNNLDMVNLLLSFDANPNAKETYGYAPLAIACRMNLPSIVQALLMHPNIDKNILIDNQSLLAFARQNNYTDIVNILVNDPTFTQELLDETIQKIEQKKEGIIQDLHLAAKHNQRIPQDIFNLITPILSKSSYDENLNKQDDLGNTPLHYACKNNDEGLVRELLSQGANPTIKNKKGKDPDYTSKCSRAICVLIHNHIDKLNRQLLSEMYEALGLKNKPVDIAKVISLLRQGADPNKTDGFREKYLTTACQENNTELALILLYFGAEPNQKFYTCSLMPLEYACQHNNTILARALLAKGASPTTSALIHTYDANAIDLFIELVKHGANINHQWVNGKTFLHRAIENSQIDWVNTLLPLGINPNIETSRTFGLGETALQFARRKGHTEIIHILEKHVTE